MCKTWKKAHPHSVPFSRKKGLIHHPYLLFGVQRCSTVFNGFKGEGEATTSAKARAVSVVPGVPVWERSPRFPRVLSVTEDAAQSSSGSHKDPVGWMVSSRSPFWMGSQTGAKRQEMAKGYYSGGFRVDGTIPKRLLINRHLKFLKNILGAAP